MMKQNSAAQQDSSRSPFRRYALAATGALAASGVAGTAHADFFYFDIPDVTANDGETIFFNMGQGTAGVGTPTEEDNQEHNWKTTIVADHTAWRIGNYLGGYDKAYVNEFASNVVEFELVEDPITGQTRQKKKATKKATKKRTVSGGNSGGNPPGTTVARLAEHFLINENSFFEIDNHLDGGVDATGAGGPWHDDDETTGFVGLKMLDPAGASAFGWIKVTYNGEENRMTLHDFAISDSREVSLLITGTRRRALFLSGFSRFQRWVSDYAMAGTQRLP